MSTRAGNGEVDSGIREWCSQVAALVADALLTADIVTHDQLERTAAIAEEEIYARLCVRDYPPRWEPE